MGKRSKASASSSTRDSDIQCAELVYYSNADEDTRLLKTDFMHRLQRYPENIIKRIIAIGRGQEIIDDFLPEETLEREIKFLKNILPEIAFQMGFRASPGYASKTLYSNQPDFSNANADEQAKKAELMNDIASCFTNPENTLTFKLFVYHAVSKSPVLWDLFEPLINREKAPNLRKLLSTIMSTGNGSVFSHINDTNKFNILLQLVVNIHFHYDTEQNYG